MTRPVEPPAFRAAALPRGVEWPGGEISLEVGDSRVVHPDVQRGIVAGSHPGITADSHPATPSAGPHPDPAWIDGLLDRLAAARPRLLERPAAHIATALGRVGRRFLDPDDPLRREALAWLPATSGLSPEMSALVLDGMAADWTPERLEQALRSDFSDPGVLDGFVDPPPRGGASTGTVGPPPRSRLRALGPHLCFQVASGSVPGVSATALARALLVKAPTLVKPGLGDVVLPVLFARALAEEDPELADAAAVVYWPGGSTDVEDRILARADAVVVYGGDDTVASLRSRSAPGARFVAYPHRVGVGLVGRDALGSDRLADTARRVARAASVFDQRGCVSPRMVFVEADPKGCEVFAAALADAFRALEVELPSGRLDPAEASALQQVRGTAELLRAAGRAEGVRHGGAAPWTVLHRSAESTDPHTVHPGHPRAASPDDPRAAHPDLPHTAPPDLPDALACVGRVVHVEGLPDLDAVPARLAPLGPHLQSAALAVDSTRRVDLAEALARVGVSRVTTFDAVAFPPAWWRHDGRGPLEVLVRWVELEG